MAAADKAEHRHAGGARRRDARDAVLDHQAIARRGAHRSRREQEEIGARLARATSAAEKMLGANRAS